MWRSTHFRSALQWTLLLTFVSNLLPENFVLGLVAKTNHHMLQYVMPNQFEQLTFLSKLRLNSPELIFWNGIGAIEEKVYILASKEAFKKHQESLMGQDILLKMEYSTVKINYVEDDADHPNQVPSPTLMDKEMELNDNDDDDMFAAHNPDEVDDMDNLSDDLQVEYILQKRNKKYSSGDADEIESVSKGLHSQGLVPIKPIVAINERTLSINSGLLYRIQSVQTLIQGNETEIHSGDWIAAGQGGHSAGFLPRVGEYFAASSEKKKDGSSPFVTAEEEPFSWKNMEYRENKTKDVLWMFVPTEYDKYFEIRNRNNPNSILVWSYDKDEGEFVLTLESRKNLIRRYQAEGDLRHRALFSLEMVPETFNWELRRNRPKFYITTYYANHIYNYESKKKSCSILIVRNSAKDPYMPEKTEKIGRPLDMFYLTRIDLTGRMTANIFSFLYEKSIVDVFAHSEQHGNVANLGEFDLMNRSPVPTIHNVYEEIAQDNNFTFHFHDKLKSFQYVTIESNLPSFGVAPVIRAGVVGKKTDTSEVHKKAVKVYKIQDKIVLDSGQAVNASIIFQYTKNFDNPFTALMEVTEPADRLYWDKEGNPRFVKLSLPGHLIEHTWNERGHFHFDRVIERREAALVLQVKGNLMASYGLRGFVKKVQLPYSASVNSCNAQ